MDPPPPLLLPPSVLLQSAGGSVSQCQQPAGDAAPLRVLLLHGLLTHLHLPRPLHASLCPPPGTRRHGDIQSHTLFCVRSFGECFALKCSGGDLYTVCTRKKYLFLDYFSQALSLWLQARNPQLAQEKTSTSAVKFSCQDYSSVIVFLLRRPRSIPAGSRSHSRRW